MTPGTGESRSTGAGLRRGRFALLVCVLLAGCAGAPETCFGPVGDQGLTPAAASDREGEVVTWGGLLVATRNGATATELTVMAYPLDDCGRPRAGEAPRGRFLVRRQGYLEPLDYHAGRPLTATGRIAAAATCVGEARPDLPLLDEAVVRLWPDPARPGPLTRPTISIGIGGGSGQIGGGIGIGF